MSYKKPKKKKPILKNFKKRLNEKCFKHFLGFYRLSIWFWKDMHISKWKEYSYMTTIFKYTICTKLLNPLNGIDSLGNTQVFPKKTLWENEKIYKLLYIVLFQWCSVLPFLISVSIVFLFIVNTLPYVIQVVGHDIICWKGIISRSLCTIFWNRFLAFIRPT